jgi:uncharacterized protein (TIGR02302 family)
MTSDPRSRLERVIGLARAALAFEAAWQALLWPLVGLCVIGAVLASGLLTSLSLNWRLPLLALAGLALLWSSRRLWLLRWPSRLSALRRIETDAALPHRPLSALDDTLDPATHEGLSQSLWQEHRQRQLAQSGQVKVPRLRSHWRERDPMALRVPAVMALVAGVVLAQGDAVTNLRHSFTAPVNAAAIATTLDAWLKPPAYTGKAPLLLTSPALLASRGKEPEITTPAGTTFTARLTGAAAPRLLFLDAAAGATPAERSGDAVQPVHKDDLFTFETKLTRSSLVKIVDGNSELGSWRIALTPDQPPTIAIVGEPTAERLGALTFKWKATDDYGVTSLGASLDLADEQADGTGFTGNGVFLFQPPKITPQLKRPQATLEEGTTRTDLTEHPWAGLMVTLNLTATDGAGQLASSTSKTFKLPERNFSHPLARALVEQRKTLIMEPDNAPQVQALLSTILLYPRGLIEKSGTHIAIASLAARLGHLRTRADLEDVIDGLWKVALDVEDGDLAAARNRLEAARKNLEDALRRGESPEKLKELMAELREAMKNYMDKMAEAARKRGNPQSASPGKTLTPEDLQKMLDEIEKLSQSGAKDQAQQLLSELERLLQNLQPSGQQSGGQGQSRGSQMMKDLSDILKRQKDLLDETQRQDRSQSGMPEQGQGESPGGKGKADGQGQGQGSPDGGQGGMSGGGTLAERQGSLRDRLQEYMGQMGSNGLSPPQSFGQAGRDMGDAKDSLSQEDTGSALGQQSEALKNLRQGARDLIRQLQEQAGNDGGQGADPLGRNGGGDEGNGNQDSTNGRADIKPGDLRRAGEILDELRQRLNLQDLRKIDRDYIERLLKGLR